MDDGYRPPRVANPHLSHVGVYVGWAEDFTYCRARYFDWNVRIGVDPFDAMNPDFRAVVEERAYAEAIRPFRDG